MFDLKAMKLKAFAPVETMEYMSADLIKQIFPLSSVTNTYKTEIFDQSGDAYKLGDFQLPIVLMLTGKDFSKATDVILNGQKLAFTIKSDSMIYAQLPPRPNAGLQVTSSLYVLVDRMDFSLSSLYSFELGTSCETVMGPAKAVMQFIKVLLTSPGSDDFDKTLGGGLNNFPGQNAASPPQILAMVTLAVAGCAQQIISRQRGMPIPPVEKLRAVDIIQMDFAKGDPTSVELRLRVSTERSGGLATALTIGTQSLSEESLGTVSGAISDVTSGFGY